uniref:DAZ-associated protein 2 n=1 Tax=Cyanistes caeruleus TaxID=156563 RepID=A0A8C0ZJT3_CYACU
MSPVYPGASLYLPLAPPLPVGALGTPVAYFPLGQVYPPGSTVLLEGGFDTGARLGTGGTGSIPVSAGGATEQGDLGGEGPEDHLALAQMSPSPPGLGHFQVGSGVAGGSGSQPGWVWLVLPKGGLGHLTSTVPTPGPGVSWELGEGPGPCFPRLSWLPFPGT